MNDKELGLDVFEMADDEEIKRIAADCPASPEEKERMFKLSQKIYNERTNESNEAHADEVSGVEQYKKPIWHKIVSAAAALALVAGLGTGGYLLARRSGGNSQFAGGDITLSDAESKVSNYPFGEIDRVRMLCPAIAPAVVELTPEKVSELTSWLDKLSWEEPENAEMPDGEYIMLYIYNNGDPYMLSVSLMDNSIRYYKSSNEEPKVYSGSEVISRFLNTIELEPDIYLYDIADISEDDTVSAVWKYVHMGSKDGFSVPDLYYKKADLAKQELRELGFEYKVVKIESTEVQPDYVVKTEPKAGTELRKGNTVTLYVSMGTGEKIKVDDYIGKTINDAVIEAGYRNLKVVTSNVVSDEKEGTVVGQEPRAGTELQAGSEIKFFVSASSASINMSFELPEKNGRYTIDIIYTDENERTRAATSGILVLPDVGLCDVGVEGSGSGIKGTAVITNLDNDKKAVFGEYILNFDNGTYAIESEDLEGAIETIE